jgi:hypothetical protein
MNSVQIEELIQLLANTDTMCVELLTKEKRLSRLGKIQLQSLCMCIRAKLVKIGRAEKSVSPIDLLIH